MKCVLVSAAFYGVALLAIYLSKFIYGFDVCNSVDECNGEPTNKLIFTTAQAGFELATHTSFMQRRHHWTTSPWLNEELSFSGRRTRQQVLAPPKQDAVEAEGRQQEGLGQGPGHRRQNQDLVSIFKFRTDFFS
jgi:hypothetical protein